MDTLKNIRQAGRVRWGILGCGDVTEVKSGPGFRLAEGSEVVAVMRRDAEKAADYARRHGVPRWYDDARALVADPEVDAIYVATPPGVHLDGASLAAAAGKPAYVEKPMARNAMECDAMLAEFRAAELPLYVAYYRRCLPRYVRAAELLAAGAVGEITGVSARCARAAEPVTGENHLPWRVDAAHSGGGLFLDLGSHTLDLLDHLLGPLGKVAGHAARRAGGKGVEDAVAMSFVSVGGVPGVASWDFGCPVEVDEVVLSGSKGRLVFSVFGPEALRLELPEGVELFDLPHPPHVQQPLIQTVVDDLLGRGTCPSTGESARRTSAVMDAVLDSYYGGRSDAFWQRPQTWPGIL
jgi:1,5-anhydro-D-fructose reductase (1,5-anhydro-D-mannitol-forming)